MNTLQGPNLFPFSCLPPPPSLPLPRLYPSPPLFTFFEYTLRLHSPMRIRAYVSRRLDRKYRFALSSSSCPYTDRPKTLLSRSLFLRDARRKKALKFNRSFYTGVTRFNDFPVARSTSFDFFSRRFFLFLKIYLDRSGTRGDKMRLERNLES